MPKSTIRGQCSNAQRQILTGLPILFEDDKQADMGETNLHVLSLETLHICLTAHFMAESALRVYADMNLYYALRLSPLPYVSPDVMVVRPFRRSGINVRSYRIGRDGPAPLFAAEILSERSWEQGDANEKVVLYAKLGIPEYAVVDVTGEWFPDKLLMMRLQKDGSYLDERDADGGITSKLGFRLVLSTDGRLRVANAATGQLYALPAKAVLGLNQAMERVRELEGELARLRKPGKPG